MRVLFVTDLHGSDVCFRKFLNSRTVFEPDVMIVGGDITGKVLIPVVVGDETGVAVAHTTRGPVELATPQARQEFERQAAAQGSYTWSCTTADLERLAGDEGHLEGLCREAVMQRVADWMVLAAQRLADSPVRVFISGGNDDYWEIDDVLRDAQRIECPDGAVVDMGQGLQLLSYGGANETPWHCPRDMSEEQLGAIIDDLAAGLTGQPAIFNLHVPPFDTRLDAGPKLDADNRPTLGVDGLERAPVGSRAVRDRILRLGPILGLHGHVHESSGSDHLGDTLVLNPGSEYSQGVLRGALVDIKAGRVKRHQFICG